MIVALLKILTSKSALEGERKQVTVLFADLKVRLVWDVGVCRMLGLEFLGGAKPALPGRDGARPG